MTLSLLDTPFVAGHNESWLPPIKSGAQAVQLLSGPALMAVAVGLQALKKNLTGTNASDLYQRVWKCISKAEARDKAGRIVQYFCRALQGFLGHMSPEHPSQVYKAAIAEVQSTLAWARRTHRWGKEMPHIPKFVKAIGDGDALEATQCAVLITFLVQDHVYWLLKVGLLKFANYTPIQWHRRNLRFITFSHVLNFSLCTRAIMRVKDKQAKNEISAEKANSEIFDNQKMMFRYVLTFIQMLHVSQVKKMDDWYIGLMGMMSAFIDLSKQWA
mmetsp:Transcript_95516/g.275188  ORF Transcript_95516/g.275188 Transcript_95516/m.275188 type:complete len:272 (+) Transcript_95516:88-903(+)